MASYLRRPRERRRRRRPAFLSGDHPQQSDGTGQRCEKREPILLLWKPMYVYMYMYMYMYVYVPAPDFTGHHLRLLSFPKPPFRRPVEFGCWYKIYQDPPVGVPCLEAERPVVWGSPARTPRKRRVQVYISIHTWFPQKPYRVLV